MPTFTGTVGNDTLTGGEGGDIIIGLAGDDSLTGGNGDDILRGDEGNDRLDGGSGRDTADYSSATSAVRVDLRTSVPQDTGGAGLDTLISIESLTGSAFDDVLIGSDSFNILIGGAGADTLTGGGSSDTFRYLATTDSTAASQDVIADFLTASDSIDITALAPTAVRITYLSNGGSQVFAETATGTLQLLVQNAIVDGFSSLLYSTPVGVQIFGSNRNESLQGGSRDDQLFGGDGNDTLFGSRGADLLTGGQGSDSFRFITALDSTAAVSDIITDFEVGRDSIDLSVLLVTAIGIGRLDNGDSVLFGQGRDGAFQVLLRNVALNTANIAYQGFGATGFRLIGSNNADVIVGTTFADTMEGSGGDDILTGGTGADAIAGGSGRDTFRYAEGDSTQAAGMDNLYDFTTGEDRIDLTGVRVSSVSLVRMADGSSLLFAGPGGPPSPPLVAIGAAGRAINAGDLDYLPLAGSNVLAVTHSFGSAVGDTLTGSARADSLYGLDGNDTLTGGGGADGISGGVGADTFVYLTASDSSQTAGYDNLYDFETGVDKIDLRALNTTSISILRSDNGSSFIFAQTPTGDFLTTADRRTVNAIDILYGANHGVYLVGSANADSLVGSAMNDPIYAGAGNDTITGGGAADTLGGQAGADTFVYVAASDSRVSAADIIVDFETGVDRIDLRGVRTGASDVFGIAYSGTGSFIFVDLGGDGTNDMLIQLANTRLVLSDILWSAGASDLEPTPKDAGPEVLPAADNVDAWIGPMPLSDPDGMLFLADGGLAPARGHDWYL